MTPTHPESELIAYLLGELSEAEGVRIAEHLTLCADCGRRAGEFRDILAGLGASQPSPPPIHWARYRRELHERLDGRQSRSWGWLGFLRPLPVALSAGAVAVGLLIFVMQGTIQRGSSRTEFSIAEELPLFQQMEVLRQYSLLDRLDLLEDLDAIRNLDRSEPREG